MQTFTTGKGAKAYDSDIELEGYNRLAAMLASPRVFEQRDLHFEYDNENQSLIEPGPDPFLLDTAEGKEDWVEIPCTATPVCSS